MIYTKQRCKKCNELKTVTDFPKTKVMQGVQKYGKTCNTCINAALDAKQERTTMADELLENIENAQEAFGIKVCKVCGVVKPLTEFYKDRISNGIQRYRNECKICAIESSKDRTKIYNERKSNVISDLTEAQWKETLAYFDNECAYCGGVVQDKEHIISVKDGGGFTKANIIPSCHRCNASKGNASLATWFPTMPWFRASRLQKIVTFIKMYS